MKRTNMSLALIGIVSVLGLVLELTLGPEVLFLYLLTLPVCLTLLWLSRDVEAFSDRIKRNA